MNENKVANDIFELFFIADTLITGCSNVLRVQARSENNITLDQIWRLWNFLKQLRVAQRFSSALAISEYFIQTLDCSNDDAFLDFSHGCYVGERDASSPLVNDVDEAELELVAVLRRAFFESEVALDFADEEGQFFDLLHACQKK